MVNFHIDVRDPLPIYAQLERAIKLAIATGAMQAGDRLPTVRELAVELKINANTIAKVYATLERQGVVATKRGVGTFASRARPRLSRGRSGPTRCMAWRSGSWRRLRRMVSRLTN